MSVTEFARARTGDTTTLAGTVWSGRFADDVSDFSDLAAVVIAALDEAFQWRRVRWQARDDVNLPNRGDRCLVAFDENEQPWVTAWWPFPA